MNTYYVDWSLRNGVTFVKNDEGFVGHEPKGTDAFLDRLKGSPSTIIMESTVHSFVKEWREKFINRCSNEGHTLLFVPPRETGRYARTLGFSGKLNDLDAPLVIREMAKRGHLRKPSPVDPAFVQKRQIANLELMLKRAQGLKDTFADELIEQLPAFKTLSPITQIALGDSKQKGYNKVAIAAAGMAAKHADSRQEFERLCGLYAHGYPSQIRADLYHWQWSGGGKRGKLNGTPTGYNDGRPEYGIRKRDDLTLTQYRKALRWLYNELSS